MKLASFRRTLNARRPDTRTRSKMPNKLLAMAMMSLLGASAHWVAVARRTS